MSGVDDPNGELLFISLALTLGGRMKEGGELASASYSIQVSLGLVQNL